MKCPGCSNNLDRDYGEDGEVVWCCPKCKVEGLPRTGTRRDGTDVKISIQAVLKFMAHGVGKHRSKHLYLYLTNNPCIELPSKYIKDFFPKLERGCEFREKIVKITVGSKL
ncbi:MAG: hypothetical protein E2O29_01645 [Deltaproteobacteria bacterium]|nr:MAG: hypothetical protein E2O29_01645 [Deltaproteobacteria bacterium]